MWYVIHTFTSKEKAIEDYIKKVVPAELYQDTVIIYYETERKYQGSWHKELKQMFPGYLFVITDDPDALKPYLRKAPEPARILGIEGKPVPLLPHEQKYFEELTGEGDTVTMSVGVKEGDRVVVNQGFLKGKEYCIRKIDRHKRKAWIEVDILGEIRTAEVGLEIVEKRKSSEDVI